MWIYASLYPWSYNYLYLLLDIFMTCIVGISHNGVVYIGGERGHSDSHTLVSSTQPKVFDMGHYLIGYAGNSGIGQAVCYNFVCPAPKTTKIDKYMATVFIPGLRSFIKENDIKIPDNEEDNAGFIVGIKGRVYEIDLSDFQCIEYTEISIGSGSSYAYGALYINKDYEPLDRIRGAIEAALLYSPTCKGPIDILQK